MATIDYKEKYEQALAKAQELSFDGFLDAIAVTDIFPELAESEDEKIRKHLIGVVELYYGNTDEQEKKDCLAWLEKQGNKSDIGISEATKQELEDNLNKVLEKETAESWNGFLEKQGEQKPVEDRYMEGYLNGINDASKTLKSDAWSEEDEENLNWFEKFFRAESVIAEGKDIPQDRYLWFKNLKDRVQPQPKQEWDEEDEKYSSYICAALDCYYRLREDRNNTNGQEDLDKARNWLYNKLKFIRPQNSSVTDEELAQAKKDAYNDTLYKIEYHSGEPTFDDGWAAAIWYLKKRNTMPQSHWKPSDEQIEALSHMIDAVEDEWVCEEPIGRELLKQLKKLKG